MSRLPPKIEQRIDGKLVRGYSILPIFDGEGNRYELTMNHKYDINGSPVGMDYFVVAYTASNEQKWKTLYTSINFEPMLETDVQEVFPVDFSIENNQLVIKHEYYSVNDRVYWIMKEDGDIKLKSPQ